MGGTAFLKAALLSIISFFLIINQNCINRSSKKSKDAPKDMEYVLKLKPGPDNPRNSEGDFITLKDGRIIFVYTHFLSKGDFGNAYLASRYSTDNGKTWSNEDEIIVKQEGILNVMSVSLLRLQNEEIALFYLRKNSESDCIPMMRISADEAKTWNEPVQCITDKNGYFVLNNDRVIQLKSGRILMPVAYHGEQYSQKSRTGKIFCYFSDDNGRSWLSSREVPNPDSVMTQEPGVVELKNGEIFMFMRTDAGVQYMSVSEDMGETWRPSEKSNIISPRSPASVERIPSTGNLLLAWNNNGINQNRTPLNVAISKDEAKTWENIKTIENDPDGIYCYMAIHFTDDHVLLSYTGHGEETINRLSLDWIKN
ncbi:MAG TPA: sialidase [Bacteroidales bacterium]|nr:sialidase [Bacteroidales bacterium]